MALKKLGVIVATFFGTGFIPIAPGTFASAFVSVIFYFLLINFDLSERIILFFIVFFISVICSKVGENYFQRKDAQEIVIDEVTGMLLSLIFAQSAREVVISFFLFRFFDITKIFPIRFIEKKFRGGFGVVMDDVAGGVYSLIIFLLLKFLILPHFAK